MDDLKKGDRVTVRLTGEPPFNGVIIGETSDGQAWHIVEDGAPNFRAESIRASVGRKSPIRNTTASRARNGGAGAESAGTRKARLKRRAGIRSTIW
jgi:hypothetical protein